MRPSTRAALIFTLLCWGVGMPVLVANAPFIDGVRFNTWEALGVTYGAYLSVALFVAALSAISRWLDRNYEGDRSLCLGM